MRTLSALACAVLAAGLGAQGFDPPVAPDLDPDPNVVEVNITAAVTQWQFTPGVNTTVYAYNGSIPGPTIMAKVGDTVKVHFTNNLTEATTIHWHGLELPAHMDGSHIAQLHVQPGQTFDYEFVVNREGLFWYHPHVNTHHQVEMGLYGTMLVRAPYRERVFNLAGMEEHIVVFDDVWLDPVTNQIMPAFPYAPGQPLADPVEHALNQVNGREYFGYADRGAMLLVNGRKSDLVTLTVPNAEPQRWHVVNVSNATICRLDLTDPTVGIQQTLWEIGSDGGFNDKPWARLPITPTRTPHPDQALLNQMGEGILLFPGQRADVVFTPIGSNGQVFQLQQEDWFRGRHAAMVQAGQIMLIDDPDDGYYQEVPYFQLQVQGPRRGGQEWQPPANLGFLPANAPPIGTLPVTFGHSPPDPVTGDITFFAQAKMVAGQMVPLPTAKMDSFEAFDVNVGETWMWEVTNLTHGDHPFHIHGFVFELVEYEFIDTLNPTYNFKFQPYARRVIRDTIRIPARLGAKGSSKTIARLITRFDDNMRTGQVVAQGTAPTFDPQGLWTSGGWLFHCHTLEHSARGMLSFFEVHDASDPFVLLGKHLAGTNGNPSLTASGTLTPGSAVTFDLVDGLASVPTVLAVGTVAGRTPLLGGELVPGAPLALVAGLTNGNGEGSWSLTQWSKLPPGTPLYTQAAFLDAGAAQGVAMTNAVTFQTR